MPGAEDFDFALVCRFAPRAMPYYYGSYSPYYSSAYSYPSYYGAYPPIQQKVILNN